MKRYLLTLLCISSATLPLRATNIPATVPDQTATNTLETVCSCVTDTFDVVSPGITSASGAAITSAAGNGPWTINNPTESLIGGPVFPAIFFPAPGVTSYTLTNGGNISGNAATISTYTTGNTTITNTGTIINASGTISTIFADVGVNFSLTNSGTIGSTTLGNDGVSLLSAGGTNTIGNTGSILGANTGITSGTITGNSSITNTGGTIKGTSAQAIALSTISGDNLIENSGAAGLLEGSDGAVIITNITGKSEINNTQSTIMANSAQAIGISSLTGNNVINNDNSATIESLDLPAIQLSTASANSTITNTNSSAIKGGSIGIFLDNVGTAGNSNFSTITNNNSTISGPTSAGIAINNLQGENTITNEDAGSILSANGFAINIGTVSGNSTITNSNNSIITGGTFGIGLVTVGTNTSNTCTINNTGSSITGTLNDAIGITTAKGSVAISNLASAGPNASTILGKENGIRLISVEGNLNITNTDSSIEGTDGASLGNGINATVLGDSTISNTRNLSTVSEIKGGASAILATVTGASTITNTGGTIIGTNAKGIQLSTGAGKNSTISNIPDTNNNPASLTGLTNAIHLTSIGGNSTITNTDSSIASTNDHAINATVTGDSTITNTRSVAASSSISSISGSAINATITGASMVSNVGGNISSSTAQAINLSTSGNSTISNTPDTNSNQGSIFGGSVGVNLTSIGGDSTITNTTSIISSANRAIFASVTGASTINNTGGTILGSFDEAIQLSTGAGKNSTISNIPDMGSNPSSISGATHAINLTSIGGDSTITNTDSTITGNSGNAILCTVTGNSTITNSGGTITGTLDEAINANVTGNGIINNSNGGQIVGLTGLFLKAPGASSTSVVNNSATIEGLGGPAIIIDSNSPTDGTYTINLMTGSTLLFDGGTKAIEGSINADSTTIVNLTGTGTQPGDFSDIQTLNKNGTETWTLTPSTVHEIDNLNVNAGTLVLNGTVQAGGLTHTTIVMPGATLMGNNTFGLNSPDSLTIQSGATHKPGNSIGSTSVNGLYTLNGTLEVEYDADNLSFFNNADTVFPTEANISGATIDAQKIAGTLEEGEQFPFLSTASLKVDGTPKDFLGGPETCDPEASGNCFGITQILNNLVDGQKLIIRGARSAGDFLALFAINPAIPSSPDLVLGGLSPNASAIAQNLNGITPPPGSLLCQLKAKLLMANPNELNDLLNLISSSPLADPSFITNENVQDILEILRSHLSNLRNNNPPPRKNSLWDQAFLSIQDRSNATQFAGIDARTYCFAAGFDRFFWNPRFQMGGTFGYVNTHLDWKRNLGSSEINSFFFGPYASYKCLNENHEGYFLDSAFLAGYHDYDNKRSIIPLGLVAKSDPNAWSIDARLGAGFNVLLADMLLTPFGYIDYLWTQQDGFTETGAGNAGFTLGKQTHDMMRYELGSSLSQNFTLGCGWVLAPKLTFSWVLKDPVRKQNLNTAFIGQNGFTLQSYDKTRNQFSAGAELTAIIREHLFISAFYTGEIGDNQHSHTTGLKGSWRF